MATATQRYNSAKREYKQVAQNDLNSDSRLEEIANFDNKRKEDNDKRLDGMAEKLTRWTAKARVEGDSRGFIAKAYEKVKEPLKHTAQGAGYLAAIGLLGIGAYTVAKEAPSTLNDVLEKDPVVSYEVQPGDGSVAIEQELGDYVNREMVEDFYEEIVGRGPYPGDKLEFDGDELRRLKD